MAVQTLGQMLQNGGESSIESRNDHLHNFREKQPITGWMVFKL